MSDEINTVANTVTQKEVVPVDPRYSIQDTSSHVDVRGVNIYDFMRHTYEGSGGYRDGTYLIPFMRESFYTDRQKSAVYKNIFSKIINAMIRPVFGGEIDRIVDDDLFENFIDNVDNAGTDLDSFTNLIITHARVYGFTMVVMDNFNSFKTMSVKEAILNREYPYMYECTPNMIHKIDVDDYGKPLSIVFKLGYHEENNKKYQLFREWNESSIVLYYDKVSNGKHIKVVLDENEHNLGVIPVIVVNYFIKDKKLNELPSPPYYSLALLTYALYNKETYIDELEKYQSFSLLVSQGLDQRSMAIGPTNFINVADNVSNLPTYISPNVDNTRVLVENCDRLKDEIYKEAEQMGVVAIIKEQSGVAKEWDFRGEESVLKETSNAANKFEQEVAYLFGLYINKPDLRLESKYPEDFSPQYYGQRINELLNILKEIPPKVLSESIWEEICSIVYRQTPERAQEIIDEMKKYANEEYQFDGIMKDIKTEGNENA